MYRILANSWERKEVSDYLKDVFGGEIRSFSMVQHGKEIDAIILHGVEKNGMKKWENVYLLVRPGEIAMSLHFLDGLYRFVVSDENEIKRIILSMRAPSGGELVGGMRIPKNTKEFYFLEMHDEVYFTDHRMVGVASMVEQRGLFVPVFLTYSTWIEGVEDITDMYLKRSIYQNGYTVRFPAELLVQDAPNEYYAVHMGILKY